MSTARTNPVTHYGTIQALCRRHVWCDSVRDDIVQECMAYLLEHAPPPNKQVSRWLRDVVRGRLKSHLRHRRRDPLAGSSPLLDSLTARGAHADTRAMSSELVTLSMGLLSHREEQVVQMWSMGWEHAEIAERCGLTSAGSSRNILHRALRHLGAVIVPMALAMLVVAGPLSITPSPSPGASSLAASGHGPATRGTLSYSPIALHVSV